MTNKTDNDWQKYVVALLNSPKPTYYYWDDITEIHAILNALGTSYTPHRLEKFDMISSCGVELSTVELNTLLIHLEGDQDEPTIIICSPKRLIFKSISNEQFVFELELNQLMPETQFRFKSHEFYPIEEELVYDYTYFPNDSREIIGKDGIKTVRFLFAPSRVRRFLNGCVVIDFQEHLTDN